MRRVRFLVWVFLLLASSVDAQTATPAEAPEVTAAAEAPGAFHAVLRVKELGVEAGLRIRIFHAPELLNVPDAAGELFLVCADSASGKDAFFIPTDLAFEFGDDLVYRVEFEQASDFFGKTLGGLLRPGEVQLGFIMIPTQVGLDRYLPRSPEKIVLRYAHHRASLHAASKDETAWWSRHVERPLLAAGLNAWWEWAQLIAGAPVMNEGERQFFAERVLPGSGHLMEEEGMSTNALRNAILRVGEWRLLESRLVQHVQPRYPAAVRQMGLHGLVIVLGYITVDGEVGDAMVLSSNTVHMLNLSALSAAREFRYARAKDEKGNFLDGWRLIPVHFGLQDMTSTGSGDAVPVEGFQPPRIVREVEAEYSTEALNRNLKGTVIYLVRLDAEGRLVETVLEEGVHPILDAAALAAVERTRFLPATQDGVTVASEIRMPFTFSPQR